MRGIKRNSIFYLGRLLPVFFLLYTQSSYSQYNHYQLQFKSITIDRGLSNNKVNAISKDKFGFLWFATNDGICKYDGINIKTYYLDPLHAESTNTNHINTLYTDSNGDLWIGAFTLFKYDYELDSVVHYSSDDSTLMLGRVRTITGNKNGELWLGTARGLFSFFPVKDSLVHHEYPDDITSEIYALLPDGDHLWVGAENYGLLDYHLSSEKFTPFNMIAGMNEDKNDILCLFKYSTDVLWIGTNSNGILQFNLSDSSCTRILPDKQNDISYRVRKIIQDDRNNIWIGTRAGLFVKYHDVEPLYHYAYTDHKTSRISDNSIYDIYIDNNKIMWFGTYAGGVNYANLIGKPIYNFSKDDIVNESLSDNLLYGFCEDEKGNLYIGTNEGGLNYFDRKKGTFKWYMKDPGKKCSIQSNNVKCIVREKSGNLWLATYRGGVNYFNIKTECFTDLSEMIKPPSDNILSDNVYSLVLDEKENLWIASEKGIDYYDRYEGKIEHKIVVSHVDCIYKDRFNNIWAGVEDVGLFEYDEGQETFIQRYTDKINFCIRTIHFDENDNMWMGGNNGLSFFNPKDSTFINYTQADSLPTNLIMGILEDDHRNLWVSTSAGLIKCIDIIDHPDKLRLRIYTVQDGLQNKNFLKYSYYKSTTGEMFFGGTKGFSMFHPDSLKDNPFVPQIALTGLKIFNEDVKVGKEVKGRVVLKKNINQSKEITLSHKHRIFTIEFTALHYASPKDNYYKYMLYPFEKTWNLSDASRPFATYTNLPGGTYTFRLLASNSDGKWTEQPRELSITILPPLWKNLWFIVFVVLTVISAFILLYYRRINAINKQKEKLELMVNERTKTITEMNVLLKNQTLELKKTNSILIDQKNQIEEQAEELELQKEELVNQKEMLQNLNSMKDKFFSIIAHDLKGPFQGILGLTELLDKNFNQFDNLERRQYFNTIYNSARNFYDLLENLLCWARTQLNHISFSRTEFDIAAVIRKNISLYEESRKNKNISLKESYESGTVVFADLNMIDTVVRNLISNAIKFTGKDGKIEIGVSGNGELSKIFVKDTGIGISLDEQDCLFQIDKSVSKHGTADEMGTGLGLIICKEFIEKNGGKIWVDSKSGKGSIFYFTVPHPNS